MRRIVPVKGHAGDATPGKACPLFGSYSFLRDLSEAGLPRMASTVLRWTAKHHPFRRTPNPNTPKTPQTAQRHAVGPSFLVCLANFPSRRCRERHFNLLSEGANAFYGHKYGQKRGPKPPTCRSKGLQSQSERHFRRSDACHRRTFRCRPSSFRRPSA